MSAVPDFTRLDLGLPATGGAVSGDAPDLGTFATPEGIDVSVLATGADTAVLASTRLEARPAPAPVSSQKTSYNGTNA